MYFPPCGRGGPFKDSWLPTPSLSSPYTDQPHENLRGFNSILLKCRSQCLAFSYKLHTRYHDGSKPTPPNVGKSQPQPLSYYRPTYLPPLPTYIPTYLPTYIFTPTYIPEREREIERESSADADQGCYRLRWKTLRRREEDIYICIYIYIFIYIFFVWPSIYFACDTYQPVEL
jgi:hypothetical protein